MLIVDMMLADQCYRIDSYHNFLNYKFADSVNDKEYNTTVYRSNVLYEDFVVYTDWAMKFH